MKNINLFGVALLASALVACGGESDDSSNSSSQNSVAISSSSSIATSSSPAATSSSSDHQSSSPAASSVAQVSSAGASSVASPSSDASQSSASSAPTGSVEIRPAKMEGFAAYTNVTGGEGGPVYIVTTGTELNKALCGARQSNRTAPVVILVNGTINHGNTTAQGCDTQGDLIEIKNTSNVSIIGVGENALFDQIGIHLRSATNIIIQNVHIRNVKKSGTPTSNGGDAIGIERDVDRVWIDHNWLEASGGEKDGYDSLLDMKDGTTNVTVSYNLFNDSSRAGLIGASDSDDKNGNITFHHNWYKNIEQRTPLIRNALVHTYNNYWSNENRDAMIHGINARMATYVLVESNYFQNVKNPLLAGSESPQAGCWQTNNDNTLVDYIYTRTVGNGAHVIPEIIDGQMQSTCSVSVPYTVDMDPADDVPAIVMANAGVGKIEVDTTGAIPVPGAGEGGDSSSGSSSSAGNPGASVELPLYEDFNVDKSTFFSANYKAMTADSSKSLYVSTGGGSQTFVENGYIRLNGARFTIGDPGEFDLSREYRISFTVEAASGSGQFYIYVDHNGTSGSTGVIFNQVANTLLPGQEYTLTSDIGTSSSYFQFRTSSGGDVSISNLLIEYVE